MKNLWQYLLIATLAVAPPLYAKKVYKQGTLMNVTAEDMGKKGSERFALFHVRIDDLIYTGRGGKVDKKSGDMGQGLIVGDPVQAAVDGDNLYLMKPGGKVLKTKIIKRERAQQRTGRGSRRQAKEKLAGLGRDTRVRCARVPQEIRADWSGVVSIASAFAGRKDNRAQ